MLRKTYHHGHLREEIIKASLKILAKKGVHALSLREAAKQAGVSSAAPYRHFPTKYALLAAIATKGYAAIGQLLRETIAKYPGDFAAQLMQAAKAYVHFAMSEPEIFRIVFSIQDQDDYPELQAAHAEMDSLFLDMIRQGQVKNLIAAGDPEEFGIAGFAFINGISSILIDKQLCKHLCPAGTDLEVWLEHLIRVIWNGFAQRPEPATPGILSKKRLKRKPAA